MISSDQIAKNYDIAGVRKANLPGLHMLLLLASLAGMFIALAGAAASVASADITNPSAARIVSALVFPAGLAMVICNGSELFTGNRLMVISARP
ncbi:MAG: formate/nitrite transporter family protein [Gallintestinimicrobium sp.]